MSTRQYIGARYVPAFASPIEWNSSRSYEALMIVTHLGSSYTSTQPVPVGTDILNSTFWALTGNYNSQVEQYRQEVGHYSQEVEQYKQEVVVLDDSLSFILSHSQFTPNASWLTVSKVGGMFTTINSAIDAAKLYCSPSNRVTIFISAGVFNEDITLLPNPGIDFIGCGYSATIISSSSPYPAGPLYTVGTGLFKNIGFVSSGVNAYAFHFESQTNPTTGYTVFDNCKFVSSSHAGVGIGMGANTTIVFNDCEIETTKSDRPAFYAHNYPADNQVNQFLYVNNCIITNNGGGIPVRIENAFKIQGGTGFNNLMYLVFNGTVARNPSVQYQQSSSVTLPYVPPSNDNITILDSSVGTNIVGLNFEHRIRQQGGVYFMDGVGKTSIPVHNLLSYSVSLIYVYDDNQNLITNTCTMTPSYDSSYVLITTTTASVFNKGVNITILLTPK